MPYIGMLSKKEETNSIISVVIVGGYVNIGGKDVFIRTSTVDFTVKPGSSSLKMSRRDLLQKTIKGKNPNLSDKEIDSINIYSIKKVGDNTLKVEI